MFCLKCKNKKLKKKMKMFRFVLVVSFFLFTRSELVEEEEYIMNAPEEKEHEVYTRGEQMKNDRDMEEEVMTYTAGQITANQNHSSAAINISKHLEGLYNGTWGTYIGVKLTDELVGEIAQPGFHLVFRYKNDFISVLKKKASDNPKSYCKPPFDYIKEARDLGKEVIIRNKTIIEQKCADSILILEIKNIVGKESSIGGITEKIQSFLMEKCRFGTKHHWIVSVGTENNYDFYPYNYEHDSHNQAIKYIFADINNIKIYMLDVEFSNDP